MSRLEWHRQDRLTMYTDRPRLFARLRAVPGVRRWQVGDRETGALVPISALPQVAGLIGARRRRLLTSEAARKRSGLSTVRGTLAG